jgi:hypothetical protein
MISEINKIKLFKIYNLNGFSLIFEMKVTSKEILSILNRDNLRVINGHIYYGNKVLKIRYDLIVFAHQF